MLYVFHYTAWSTLGKIVASAVLRPVAVGAPGERPLVWFSANQRWEPTATKLCSEPGGLRQMSFKEMAERFGAVRFALPREDPRLMEWVRACRFAGMPDSERKRLEHRGRMLGANPSHWFAIAEEVPIDSLPFQVYLDRSWRRALPDEMARVWAEHTTAQS